MKSAEYRKDIDSYMKLHTKNKPMELDIDTLSGIVQEIFGAAS